MQTKLPINGTIQHPDLAEALRGESGTFFCQQGGQGYIVTAAEGFSINHCGQSVARSWKPMWSCRLLQNPGRSRKSPRMFLSLARYHNPLVNSEPPKG